MADPIKRITLTDGTVRYRFRVDIGRKEDGRRDQRTYTFNKRKDAKAARDRLLGDRSRGTLIRPSQATLDEAVSDWLRSKRNVKPSTRRSYEDCLRRVTDRLGHIRLQALTKGHLDELVAELLEGGRRVGNVQRQSLSPRSVNLTLTMLSAVLESEVKQGRLARNVAKLVDRVPQTRQEQKTWTAEQASRFLAFTADDRLAAAFQLSLHGLRRSEVLGLRWTDVDLLARTLTIRNARTAMADGIAEGSPKTARSRRTLPLDDELVAALDALALRQREEADLAGDAYAPVCPECGGTHVVADELGRPLRPEAYGDRFEALAKSAGLPRIRLHDARHTCATLLHARGVPMAMISAWLGHSSAAFTLSVYAHSQPELLMEAGQVLRGAYQPTVRP